MGHGHNENKLWPVKKQLDSATLAGCSIIPLNPHLNPSNVNNGVSFKQHSAGISSAGVEFSSPSQLCLP